MFPTWSKDDPKWLPGSSQEAPRKGFNKESANSLQKCPPKAAQALPKGPPESTIFESFFKRFWGRLQEPSKTASNRIWKPF